MLTKLCAVILFAITSFFMYDRPMSIISFARRHAVVSAGIGVVVVVVGVIAGRAATTKTPVVDTTSGTKQVTVVNAATFRTGSLSIAANGLVQSHSQADLKSQLSAPVSVINVSIGQNVSAGQVLLELQNSDIRAQLAQSQAALSLAQGQYVTGSISLDSAKRAAIDKIQDAYNKTYDAVVTDADPVLYNNNGSGGHLTSSSLDTTLNSRITTADLDLKDTLPIWKLAVAALSTATTTADIENVIKISQKNMIEASQLMTDISTELNALAQYATPAAAVSLSAWKTAISAGQSGLTTSAQALTTAELGLNTGNSSQNTTAQAQITSAQAGVANLEAQLAKTIIRSPIAGRVSALPLREGELASAGTLLVSVIGNQSALLVKAYVSSEDLARISVGSPVVVNDGAVESASSSVLQVHGVVSNIAPGVDPQSRKAEVDIDITDSNASKLVIGDTVSVSITPPHASVPASSNQPVIYMLPIQDVKIVPGSAYVFTVGADSKIVRHDVVLGDIRGDFITVESGLTDDMDIVSPVYELDEGEVVRVAQ